MIEVNQRLCKLISSKTWNDADVSRKLDFYQKVELANPTPLMLEQSLLDILYEVQTTLSGTNNMQLPDIKYAWTMDGRPIKSVMDLHY